MKQKKFSFSLPVAVHYVKLIFRSALLVTAIVLYVVNHGDARRPFGAVGESLPIVLAVWGLFLFGMVLRLFPSRLESRGSQKHFAVRHQPTGKALPASRHPHRRAAAVAIAWVLLNGTIGVLYFLHVIDWGILVLISLFYAVADMICVLFFCPFQIFFLGNRCCTSCRIYNWDSFMMVTPLIFILHPLTTSLVVLGTLILIRWECIAHRHPERFHPETNAYLSCAQCDEHLCRQRNCIRRTLAAPFSACRRKRDAGDGQEKNKNTP